MAESARTYGCQVLEDVIGSKGVQSGDALVDVAVHGVGFARAGLSVGEAGHFGSLEGRVHQWSDC